MTRNGRRPPLVAVIDEQACIGCTLCLAVCPVDAIVGATKLMHTVIAAECTGCKWCLPPCPVDCIAMVERGPAVDGISRKRQPTVDGIPFLTYMQPLEGIRRVLGIE